MSHVLVLGVRQVLADVVLVSPFKLRVWARGVVSSSGWSNARLRFVTVEDGSAIFDFEAEPPEKGKIVLPRLQDVEAVGHYVDDPSILTRITVRSKNNAETIELNAAPFVVQGGGVLPWPWHLPSIMAAQARGGDTWPFRGGDNWPFVGNGSTWPFGGGGDPAGGRTLVRKQFSSAYGELIGMRLRVLKPGEVGSTDFDQNRLTLYLGAC
jgi:hypothetical protein